MTEKPVSHSSIREHGADNDFVFIRCGYIESVTHWAGFRMKVSHHYTERKCKLEYLN